MAFRTSRHADSIAAMVTRGMRAATAGFGMAALVLVIAMVVSNATIDLRGIPAVVAILAGCAVGIASWRLETRN